MGLSSLLPNFDDETIIPPDESKYRLIRSYMPGVIQRDYNQTQARQLFRSSGFRFSDARFNSIYNEVRDSEQRFSTLRTLETQNSIKRSHLVEATRPITNDIRLVANFDVNVSSGIENIRGSFALDVSAEFFPESDDDDILTSVEAAEQQILEAIAKKYEIPIEEVQNIRIMYGFYDPGLGN